MKFVDEVRIFVKAGDGGNGAVSFRREKFIERGGPNGGDGGNGGSVVFVADPQLTTLLDFRYQQHHRAKGGENGMGSDCNGRGAEDLILKVPVGTLIRDADTDELLVDLSEPGQQYVAAKGGRGGLGNMNFATSTRQTPRFAQEGTKGEERTLRLELKLDVHGSLSGVASFVHDDEESCLADVRYLLSLLPSNNLEPPPSCEPPEDDDVRPELASLVPVQTSRPYDIRAVIGEVVDDGDFLEVHEGWAANVVCALARIGGEVVGVVGNQPLVLAGVLDTAASQKAARFVRFCDAFNIPLVTLVDVPGFLPGTDQEYGGAIRHGAKLLYAYCEASVPRVQVILRKAYGGAYIVMDSRSIGCDLSLAWPTNEIAVMGAEAAVNVIHRKELAAAADPDQLRQVLVARYTDELAHPYYAAERGLVDDVIDPAQTRAAVRRGLAMLRDKRGRSPARKHGNVPL